MKCLPVALLLLVSVASSLEGRRDTKTLGEAPAILVGRVGALHRTGDDVLWRGAPIKVEVYDASVVVEWVIRGDNPGQRAAVKHLLRPSNTSTYIGRQVLIGERAYVFFLSPRESAGEFAPIDPGEFALEIESLPEEQGQGESVLGHLRTIARRNIDTARESVATRWFAFLGEHYDVDEDVQFCWERTRDTRLGVRGSALAILCEHSPGAKSLYPRAIEFLKETSQIERLWQFRRRISRQLPKVLEKGRVTRQILKAWLASGVPELQEVALGLVMTRRDAALAGEVAELMVRTGSRQMQYDCVQALCVMEGKRGPSYQEFRKSPDRYMKQWKE